MEKLLVRTNRTVIELAIVMKNHLAVQVAEAAQNGSIVVASSFVGIEEAKQLREFIDKFIEYDGKED